jgi:pimeloyl-ACP methyl ester carboxylesterase
MRTIWLIICQCLLVTLPSVALTTNDTWVDKSPHTEKFVKVNGVSLEFLDWGGQGEALVFLAGLGNTAHIFDNLAPQFTNHFHVLGLTRRGYGRSDKPQTGYDITTLVDDLHQFLDAMGVKRVILVGHSFAGAELTGFACMYPKRVDKLVYLDCAYSFDQPGTMEVLTRMDSLTPGPSPETRTNFVTLRDWFRNNRPGWNDACESDLRNTRAKSAGGYSGHSSTPDSVEETLEKDYFGAPKDYTKLTMPVLAIFADHQLDKLVRQVDAANRPQAEQTRSLARSWEQGQIENFKKQAKRSQVAELADTDHFCFIQRQTEVVRLVQPFLEQP